MHRPVPSTVLTAMMATTAAIAVAVAIAGRTVHWTTQGAARWWGRGRRGRRVPRSSRPRRLVQALLVTSLSWVSWTSASAVCLDAVGAFVDRVGGRSVPCLMDLATDGVCFELPGRALEPTVWAFDAFLQEGGLARPFWEVTPATHGVRFTVPAGDTVEVVLALSGPFEVVGVCRWLPAR